MASLHSWPGPHPYTRPQTIMGNKNSTGSEPSLSNYSQAEDIFSSIPLPNRNLNGNTPSPPFPSRSFTVSERHRVPETQAIPRSGSDASVHRSPHHTLPLLPPQTTTDSVSTSDELSKHIVETFPNNGSEGISLGGHISVTFDKDVKTVNSSKLFEVMCDSIDPALNPIKGHANYDSRLMKADFTPTNTFLPNAHYTVHLKGRAITTALCSQGANIIDEEFRFQTCDPSPKSIGIKLKGESNSEQLQIASYYDLYNSLILWCTKKWGCSGEHITSVYSEKEGRTLTIKGDIDVLNVNENEVIVVEIKD